MDDTLFDLPPTEASQREPERQGRPRLQRPERDQITLQAERSREPPVGRPPGPSRLGVRRGARALGALGADPGDRGPRGPAADRCGDPDGLLVARDARGRRERWALDRQCAGHDAYRWLVDGGFVNLAEIAALAERAGGTTLYAPPPSPRDPTGDRHVSLPTDSPAVVAWRVRMGTPEATRIYRERAAVATCVNAIARNRGLRHSGVRGRAKARAILAAFALAHNLIRAVALRAAAAAPATCWTGTGAAFDRTWGLTPWASAAWATGQPSSSIRVTSSCLPNTLRRAVR